MSGGRRAPWRRFSGIFLSLCCLAGIIASSPRGVEGAESEALGGDKYQPSTDVDYIIELTELLSAIDSETSIEDGTMQYKRIAGGIDGISLESLGNDETTPGIYLDPRTNPLYSVYMYAFWRSHNGSGKDGNDQEREYMKFLNDKVDNYGHTIINDELKKGSGYDPVLTAETIRVTNMWMATVQSLYDAVELCDEAAGGGAGIVADPAAESQEPDFKNPVDQAAAFWYGDLADETGMGEASLYSWAEKIRDQFDFGTNPSSFDANKEMERELIALRGMMDECLEPMEGDYMDVDLGSEAEKEDTALLMRVLVDQLTRAMTVPLVQNLIHHAALVATSPVPADAESVDYMILYGLVTLPPIIICDEIAYDNLYGYTVTNGKTITSSILYNALNSLYARFICLGITCDQLGESKILRDTEAMVDLGGWPDCHAPSTDLKGYPYTSEDQFVEFLKVDLDVRTIGTLIEMDAATAAYDVYHWGMHSSSSSMAYYSIQSAALEDYHASNTVGQAFAAHFPTVTDYADLHEYGAMMGQGDFEDATLTQRRIIAEAGMVMVTMYAFAMNNMYKAIDSCLGGDKDFGYWDRAFASLSGWAQEDESAKGFLLMEVEQYLCDDAGDCDGPGGSPLVEKIYQAFVDGKTSLTNNECSAASLKTKEIEKYVLTVLVDLVAYFAELIDDDTMDADNLAEGYGAATALVPLMQPIHPTASAVVESNMGTFPNTAAAVFSKGDVFDALSSFVTEAGVDCALLTRQICEDRDGGLAPVAVPTTASLDASTGMYPSYAPAPLVPTDETLGLVPDDEDYVTSSDIFTCGQGIDGGVPNAVTNTGASGELLLGAYRPTSNVDHIVKLTENLALVATSITEEDGRRYYEQIEEGVSLQCLSTGARWVHITQTNPLYVIYMYGLWLSDDGDSDGDGYSNKMFDEEDILNYGDTVVSDEFKKSSGFDPELSAETILLMNMWMAMTTELYRAVDSCRGGYVDQSPAGFNPVDFAAAFWFGSATNPDSTEGWSLYAWAKKADANFVGQSMGVNEEIIDSLENLQQSFNNCRGVTKELQEEKGIAMKNMADEITRVMVIPMVQHFIYNLAEESGMAEQGSDERNRMVLYALSVLPLISICDEDTFDDLFYDLVSDIDSYDSATFTDHIETLYSRLECLGISCDMVGTSILDEGTWPECRPPSATTQIAGYSPTTDASLQMLKFDLDIGTILAFIIMEANDAALDIYENGRNVKSLTKPNAYIPLNDVKPIAGANYDAFAESGTDYTGVTKNAITGKGAFLWSSPLQNSAAASLAIATIDMHLSILDDLDQSVSKCELGASEAHDHWDSAVAAMVGWTVEGIDDDDVTGVDDYLLFQLAEELCDHFETCDDDEKSTINNKIFEEFTVGQVKLKSDDCDEVAASRDAIKTYMQAILVDNLAYHTKIATSVQTDRHCLMAYVARNALVPLLNETSAKIIEDNVRASETECVVDDIEAVYKALNEHVEVAGIDCSWLGSSVCNETSTTVDLESNSVYTPNVDDADGKYTIYGGEYWPMTNVERLHDISTVVEAICNADVTSAAKDTYLTDETAGLSIKSMSLSAKYAMNDELQFNQYVYALQDSVDKTDGSLHFDGKPAGDYANTISSDALDTSTALGCRSVKVLNIWMWTVHKLNDAIEACKDPSTPVTGELDEAAALWDGGLLFEMAEYLAPKFGQVGETMSPLNRKIVDRLKKARNNILASGNKCDDIQVHDLRIIVKETISYMTAVLIQSFIDSMIDDYPIREKQEMVELMAFATLPHIKACGHEAAYEKLYNDLIGGGFEINMVGDTLSVLQSHYNCLGLSCGDVGRHTQASTMHPQCSENHDIAGYTPFNATKTNMLAKLDLDAVAIHQLMSMEKSEAAKRIYLEGHNYYDYDNQAEYNFVSLHSLTQRDTIEYTEFEMYRLYADKLGEDFGNDVIIKAIDREGIFANTTANQRDLAVNIAISSIVSYMSALEALYLSASVCETNKAESVAAFDGAVALLVGSVEGRGLGGNVYQEGRMFYSIGKRTCNHARNCRGGDAEVNVELMRAFVEGHDFIQQGNCAEVAKAADAINSLLKVPLIQSLLYFSDKTISEQTNDDAAGYVATMAAYPILADIDQSSADKIKTTMEEFSGKVPGDSESVEVTVYDALSDFFSNPNTPNIVDCELVTKLDSICSPDTNIVVNPSTPDDGDPSTPDNGDPSMPDDESDNQVEPEPVPVEPEEPMPISNGLYVATNYVGDRSAIARDVEEIRERIKANNVKRAKEYYNEGENSKIYDANGMPTGELRSIARFSTESNSTMKGDPTYNLYINGLSDENQEFLGRPVTKYADSFISDLLFLESPEAPDAMIAITIWMQVAHSLHSAYNACKMSFLTDGRKSDGRLLQNSDPALLIDEAAAYWIGDNQATGSSSKGHLLYALTERTGGEFEKISDGAESHTNTRIIDLFNKAKNHIAISRGCSTSEDSHLKLKGIVDELIPLMAVPLLRDLIYHLSNDNPVRVKIAATAVLPLFSACSPATYRELKDLLIDHDVIEMQKEYIFSKIQSMYTCLGLTCALVGRMSNEECDDGSNLNSLAGYRFVSDQKIVNRASQIDVDMSKVEIFIKNGATLFKGRQEVLFGTAFDLYRYGQHSDTKGSLGSMAKDTNKEIVPVFGAFRRYFKSDENYADTMISNAFQKKGVFKQATVDQRKRFIVFSLKYMLTYMATLQRLYSSVRSCNEDDKKEAAENLDLAAAYFVGSLEGKDDGGSYDGSLIFMLAKRMCVHFGTCTPSNHARINERIISLFYASQAEIETGACEPLERTVKEIENAMIVPLIQGVLYSARENENYYKQGYTRVVATEFYPEGFALAQSILPIIDDADQMAAKDIKTVMVAGFPNSANDASSNDSAKIHNAVQSALTKMNGVDCSEIGSLGGQGFCPGDRASFDNLNPASRYSISLLSLITAGVLLFALC